MNVNVTEFKAKCTGYLKDISQKHRKLEITKRGKVIAIVTEPPRIAEGRNPLYAKLNGTVLKVSKDFEEPMGDKDWEACD